MTATLRCTVDALDTDDASRDHRRSRVQPDEVLRTHLGRALLSHLSGEAELAACELRAVDQADVARAVGVLTEATAATWSQLERRAIYPIPLDHVVARLHAVGRRDLEVSIDLLRRAVLATAGVRIAVGDLIHAHGSGGALHGAFDATSAVIRFAGQRWWRPTADILIDLGLGDQDSNR